MMRRQDWAWLAVFIAAGVVDAFLHTCWDLAVDRDRTLDRTLQRHSD